MLYSAEMATQAPVKTDVNAIAGALLRDLAYAQTSPPKMYGYKRAAGVVLSLETSLADLVQSDGTLPHLAGIGPASTRIIMEVLASGGSETVERLVAASGSADDIRRRRSLREHFLSRAEALRILRDPSIGGPNPADYRGDLQMHSEWSDGASTLSEIADACRARGDHYAAITDHSYGLKIAGGMSMDDAARQHEAIDRVNASHDGAFRLIKGIEANINKDGRLDLSADEAAGFELVLAAPHSQLRVAADQTERLIRAVRTPHVRILAHPRGRITGSRGGVHADWPAVFAAAAEANVAVEIDGDPSRQDLDYSLASLALDAGCLFALDSDAHSTHQLHFRDFAIAHARLARIPVERIVNCWDVERLEAWLRLRPT